VAASECEYLAQLAQPAVPDFSSCLWLKNFRKGKTISFSMIYYGAAPLALRKLIVNREVTEQ
jgi:hypothetical protein